MREHRLFSKEQQLKHHTAMKKILDDIKAENFTKQEFVVYGIIAPLALVAMTILGGLLS